MRNFIDMGLVSLHELPLGSLILWNSQTSNFAIVVERTDANTGIVNINSDEEVKAKFFNINNRSTVLSFGNEWIVEPIGLDQPAAPNSINKSGILTFSSSGLLLSALTQGNGFQTVYQWNIEEVGPIDNVANPYVTYPNWDLWLSKAERDRPAGVPLVKMRVV